MAINLNKIVLEKSGDKKRINLAKDVEGQVNAKEIIINLSWTNEKKEIVETSFWGSLKNAFLNGYYGVDGESLDLDLGCFYELLDGTKMVIDGVQFAHNQGGPKNVETKQGRYDGSPWVWHTGDDRYGTGIGENILVNPIGVGKLKRLIIYCFIYKGVVRWSQTNAVATVKVPGNPEIVVEMGVNSSAKMLCALAEISFEGKESLTVKKLVSFHSGHADCDKAYNWGLDWHKASK